MGRVSNPYGCLVSRGSCNWFYMLMLQSLRREHGRWGGSIRPAPKGDAVTAGSTLVLCLGFLQLGVPLPPLVPVTASPSRAVQSLFRNSSHTALADLGC